MIVQFDDAIDSRRSNKRPHQGLPSIRTPFHVRQQYYISMRIRSASTKLMHYSHILQISLQIKIKEGGYFGGHVFPIQKRPRFLFSSLLATHCADFGSSFSSFVFFIAFALSELFPFLLVRVLNSNETQYICIAHRVDHPKN